MSFLLYILSFIVFISGLAWVATLMGASQAYVAIAALVLLAFALVSGLARARSSLA